MANQDDVVFHDRFSQVFPRYWDQVPADFEFIWVGQNFRSRFRRPGDPPYEPPLDARLVATPELPPYGMHAAIVSFRGAARILAKLTGKLPKVVPGAEPPVPPTPYCQVRRVPQCGRTRYCTIDPFKAVLGRYTQVDVHLFQDPLKLGLPA